MVKWAQLCDDGVKSVLVTAIPVCWQVLELEPGNRHAAAQAAKLEPVVLEQREKMKDEMIGALIICAPELLSYS